MNPLHLLVLTLTGALPLHLPGGRARDDRGDVPGWVLVTVMSAAIVAALTTVAREELSELLRRALRQVQ
jgi:hypothetical protein